MAEENDEVEGASATLVMPSDSDLLIASEFIDSLGIDTEAFTYFGEHLADFTPIARTFQVPVAKHWRGEEGEPMPGPVAFPAYTQAPVLGEKRTKNDQGRWVWDIKKDGVQIPASIQCHDAHLTRLTLLKQNSPSDGHQYLLLTGVMRVRMDVFVTIDNKVYPLVNLLCSLVNNTLPAEKRMTVADFVRNADESLGIRFGQTMPLLWQHFGVNGDVVYPFMQQFESLGAEDVTTDNDESGRMIQQLAFPRGQSGIPVMQFEMGQSNRAFSQTKQGFLDPVLAQIENFVRIITHRRLAREIGAELSDKIALQEIEDAKARGGKTIITSEEKKAQTALARTHVEMSRRFAANWAGVQQRTKLDKIKSTDEKPFLFTENFFDPVNAPCGRLTLIIDDEPQEVDFWQRGGQEARLEGDVDDAALLPGGAVDDDLDKLGQELGNLEQF